MIEVKGADIIAAFPPDFPFPLSHISGMTFSMPEPKETIPDTMKSLTRSFEAVIEATLETKLTMGYLRRRLIDACSNNELKRHHQHMKRRRPDNYKKLMSITKAIRTGRGDVMKKIKKWEGDTWNE